MTLESIVLLMLDVAAKGTVLLVLVGVGGWFFARHRPALRALLWGGVFIALVFLPIASLILPALQLPILPVGMPDAFVADAASPAPDELSSWSSPSVSSGGQRRSAVTSQPFRESTFVPSRTKPNPQLRDWQMPAWPVLVLGVYVLGLGFCLVRLGLGWRRVSTLRLNVHRFAGLGVMARLDRWCARLGVKDGVDIGISDRVSVPTVVGLFRPLIVVPEQVAEHGTDADWDGILVHELAHVKRGDAYWNLLGMIVTALYWFHPLVYWARRDLASTREYACDDWAVQILGDSESYATTLMEVTARTDRRLFQALGLDMARTSRVLHRVNRILSLSTRTVPEMSRMVSCMILILIGMSAGLLGSLRPTSEHDLTESRSVVTVDSGNAAANWMRQQYFLHDYITGSHEGEKLTAQFPNHVALKAWHALHLVSGFQADAGQRVAAAMPEGDTWADFARAFTWRKDRSEEALSLSQRALMARPNDPDFLWMRAQVLWKARGSDAAIAFIDQNADRLQNSAELLAAKGKILAYPMLIGRIPKIKKEDIDAAFETFEKAQHIDPENVSAHFWHGFYLSRMQRKAEAYPLVKHAAQLSPHARRIHMIYWHVTLDMPGWPLETKRAEIEADIDHFLKGRETYPELFSTAANMLDWQLGENEKRQIVSNYIMDEFPNTPEAERELVRQYRALKTQMINNAPAPEIQKEYRARLHAFINRPVHQDTRLLGSAYLSLYCELKPDSTTQSEELLRVVQGMAKYNRSGLPIPFCDGPITLAERTPYFREAESIVRQGFEVARDWEERHQDKDGLRATDQQTLKKLTAGLHDARGWIYFQEGRIEEAETELLKAYELYPELWMNLCHLGQYYTQMENWDRAESFCIQAMKRFWNNPVPDRGLQELYRKRHGHLAGFDPYLASIKKTLEVDRKARVLSERVNLPNPVPMFGFDCLDGSVVSLPALRGKVVVIDVGRRVNERQLDALQQLHTHFETRGDVVVVHANLDDRLKAVAQTGAYDFSMAMGHPFVNEATLVRYPATWFLDRQGQIAYKTRRWGLREAIWRVEALLEEAVVVN